MSRRKTIWVELYQGGAFFVREPKGIRGRIFSKLFNICVTDKSQYKGGMTLIRKIGKDIK